MLQFLFKSVRKLTSNVKTSQLQLTEKEILSNNNASVRDYRPSISNVARGYGSERKGWALYLYNIHFMLSFRVDSCLDL